VVLWTRVDVICCWRWRLQWMVPFLPKLWWQITSWWTAVVYWWAAVRIQPTSPTASWEITSMGPLIRCLQCTALAFCCRHSAVSNTDLVSFLILSLLLLTSHIVARYFAVFFLCLVRYLGGGGTDRREILHDGTHRSWNDVLHFGGRYAQGIPKILKFWPKFWPLNHEYLENGKSKRYMSIRA